MSNKKYEFKGTQGQWGVIGHGYHVRSGLNQPHAQALTMSHSLSSDGTLKEDLEGKANAHLIAAAPDLLDFAVMMLQSIDGGGRVVTVQDHHIDELRAAIHKALNIQE